MRPRRRSPPSTCVMCRSSPRPAAASTRSSRLPTTTWARGPPARPAPISPVTRICVRRRATPACAGSIYVSFRGVAQDAPVDIFRVKWYIEDAIRRSGVPYVMLRPTAFMDIWIDQILAKGIREKGVATIFGDGHTVANYIAVDDVAEFAVKILARRSRERGGRGRRSIERLAEPPGHARSSAASSRPGKRRHVPVAAMRLLPPIVRPFNEVAARLMTLGLYSATKSAPFPGWKASADRFGVRRGRSKPTSIRWFSGGSSKNRVARSLPTRVELPRVHPAASPFSVVSRTQSRKRVPAAPSSTQRWRCRRPSRRITRFPSLA